VTIAARAGAQLGRDLAGLRSRGRLPLLVLAVLAVVWIVVAAAFSSTGVVPYPWTLAAQIAADSQLLAGNAAHTLARAAQGLMWAAVVVVPLAVVCFLLPTSQPVVFIVATVVHVIPTVAIAPILIVAVPPETARVIITALAVYFPMLIGLLLGFRSVDGRILDVIAASGGGGWAKMRFLRVQSAAPSVVAALQIGVPSAVLGALISEFFGADRGLGAVLLASQEQFLVTRVWAIGVFAGIIAAIGYALVAVAARFLVPWAGRGGTVGTEVAGGEAPRLGAGRSIGALLLAFAVVLAFWYALRGVFGLSDYFVKLPHDVVRFLAEGDPRTGAGPEVFWGTFLTAIGETTVQAAVGFVAGTALAIGGAIVLVALPRVSAVIMPLAVVLRSIPMLAMIPVIVIVFGRGLLAVTVVVVLITFFPTLVNVMSGLRAAPEGAVDVIRASGGSGWQAARRIRVLYAVPSIIASAQIAVPASIAAATLAEWLATGDGIGHLLAVSSVRAQYLQLWAASALLVLLVLLAYAVLSVVSAALTRRIGIAG
jgi:ABC-type nitrate/sulfonate/bicarbonate transport system permease component